MKPVDTIKAPPFIIRVAASGTTSTLHPSYVKSYVISAIAVVLPAHGPPVNRIRTRFALPRSVFLLTKFKGGFKLTLSIYL